MINGEKMDKRVAILGIDLQKDFTEPSGALFVSNANRDVVNISNFIRKHHFEIDYVALTLDSHQPIHIAHQCYWKNEIGESPSLFSVVSSEDVRSEKWIPQYNKEQALLYLDHLDLRGEVCTIWPMHCILGTKNWALDDILMDELVQWSIHTGYSYELYYKGYSQSTEHYSIFRAAVEWDSEPETKLNVKLLSTLEQYNEVILVGEAADYCVASSLNDILKESDELAKKMTVLTDCMSWINPSNERAKSIFKQAEKQGARFSTSFEYAFRK